MRASRPVLSILCAVGVAAVPSASASAADPVPTEPQPLFEAAAKNFAQLESYRLRQTVTDEGGTATIRADVTAKGDADVQLSQRAIGSFRIRRVASKLYLLGSDTYWRTTVGGRAGKQAAKELGGRWVRTTGAAAKGLRLVLGELAPKRFARCLTTEGTTGTLTLGAPTTYGGAPVTVLQDAGDRPGTGPGTIYLAAGERPLPLRVIQTGRTAPGGKANSCQDPEDTTTKAELLFSKFDAKLAIRAPKHALAMPKAQKKA